MKRLPSKLISWQEIFCLSEPQLVNEFRKISKEFVGGEGWVIFEGTIPIALIAHLDTVHQRNPKTFPPKFFYNTESGMIWAPKTGLGADDRAGVMAIYSLLERGYSPWVILTDGEESGLIGARNLAQKHKNCPIPNLKFMLELDRRGEKDCVFYEQETLESQDGNAFKNYLESKGFAFATGSSSDIRALAPQWKIAAANLSIGYENEHSNKETFNLHWWNSVLERVETILEEADSLPNWGYEEKTWKRPGIFSQASQYSLPQEAHFQNSRYCRCPKCIKEKIASHSNFKYEKQGSLEIYRRESSILSETLPTSQEVTKEIEKEKKSCFCCFIPLESSSNSARWQKIHSKLCSNHKKCDCLTVHTSCLEEAITMLKAINEEKKIFR